VLWNQTGGGWAIFAGGAVDSQGNSYFTNQGGILASLTINNDWRFAFMVFNTTIPNPLSILTAPTLSNDESVVYFGANDNYLYAVLTASGSQAWRYETGGPVQSSASVDSQGNIYFGSNDNSVYAITSTGSLIWKFDTFGIVQSSPVIDSFGSVYVGSFDNILYGIQGGRGLQMWYFESGVAPFQTSPVIGPDRTIYIGDLSGMLYALAVPGPTNQPTVSPTSPSVQPTNSPITPSVQPTTSSPTFERTNDPSHEPSVAPV